MMLRRNQTGDTIVEVLVAITVVSAMLGVAFVTVNRASNNARQAQERGVATKLLESQVERLKLAATATTGTTIFNNLKAFCIINQTTVQDNNFSLFSVPADPDADNFTVNYDSKCTLADDGTEYVAGTSQSNPYYIVITRSGLSNNNFTVYCRWPSVNATGNEQASISYRINQ